MIGVIVSVILIGVTLLFLITKIRSRIFYVVYIEGFSDYKGFIERLRNYSLRRTKRHVIELRIARK